MVLSFDDDDRGGIRLASCSGYSGERAGGAAFSGTDRHVHVTPPMVSREW